MVKGRVKSAKQSKRRNSQSMKSRDKASAKQDSVKKVSGKSPGTIKILINKTAKETTSNSAPAPAPTRAITQEELKQFSHFLEQLQSDPDGMSVLAKHLNSAHQKTLIALLTKDSDGQTKDVTQKLQNELKRSEELLRTIHTRERHYLDVVHSVLMVLDADQTIRMMSKSGCKLLGYDVAALVGKRWIDEFVPKAHHAVVQAIHARVMNGTLTDEYEYPVTTRSGEERTISWRSTVLKDVSGNVTGLLCSGEDLTMLRQINAALARSEERLHLMMDSVGEDEFFITDPDGYIVSWIARSKDGKNYRAEEMLGKHFSCLYSPEDFQAGKPMRILETAQNTGRYEEDGWRMRKDGNRSRAYVIVTAIKDNERHLLGFSSVTRYVVEAAEAQTKRLFPLAVPVFEYP